MILLKVSLFILLSLHFATHFSVVQVAVTIFADFFLMLL
jgi:hypothetical protein